MKNMKIILGAAVVSVTMLLASCAKDGVQGPVGPAGSNGTNGTNGNANVMEYFFRNDSVSATHDFARRLPIRFSSIDSAVVLFYYYDPSGSAWYPSPGLGAYAAYQTRFFTAMATSGNDSTDLILRVYDPTGGSYAGTVTISKAKLILIPASSILPGKKAPVDYNNYSATMRYFGLKE
jgi:hypothetical protein